MEKDERIEQLEAELAEVCQKIADGRVVVLPCKVGDDAWWLTGKRLIKCRIPQNPNK